MVSGSFSDKDKDRLPSPFSGGGFFDDLLHNLQDNFTGGVLGRFGSTDIYEKDGKLHYEIELPGMDKEDISIKVKGDRLVVSGEVSQDKEEKGVNYYTRGRRYGSFQRSFPLPEEIEDPNELKAQFENGILHIAAKLRESLSEGDVFDVEIE